MLESSLQLVVLLHLPLYPVDQTLRDPYQLLPLRPGIILPAVELTCENRVNPRREQPAP